MRSYVVRLFSKIIKRLMSFFQPKLVEDANAPKYIVRDDFSFLENSLEQGYFPWSIERLILSDQSDDGRAVYEVKILDNFSRVVVQFRCSGLMALHQYVKVLNEQMTSTRH